MGVFLSTATERNAELWVSLFYVSHSGPGRRRECWRSMDTRDGAVDRCWQRRGACWCETLQWTTEVSFCSHSAVFIYLLLLLCGKRREGIRVTKWSFIGSKERLVSWDARGRNEEPAHVLCWKLHFFWSFIIRRVSSWKVRLGNVACNSAGDEEVYSGSEQAGDSGRAEAKRFGGRQDVRARSKYKYLISAMVLCCRLQSPFKIPNDYIVTLYICVSVKRLPKVNDFS